MKRSTFTSIVCIVRLACRCAGGVGNGWTRVLERLRATIGLPQATS